MSMKTRVIFCVLFSLYSFHAAISQTYILIPQKNENIKLTKLFLNSNYKNYKALVYNISGTGLGIEDSYPLINLRIFSDSAGNFKSEYKTKEQIRILNALSIDSMLKVAERNAYNDLERDVIFFEQRNFNQNPIQISNIRVLIETDNGQYQDFNCEAYCAFFLIKQYKQFLPFQSSASVININAPKQQFRRKKNFFGQDIVDWSKTDSSKEWYFSNKIFLEKINADKSYHFIRLKQICNGCKYNYNQEFDYMPGIGITRFWWFISPINDLATGDIKNPATNMYVIFSSAK